MFSFLKYKLLGKPGRRARTIRLGLLRGLRFFVDTSNKSQRLLGLDELEIKAATQLLASHAISALDIGANDGWYTTYFASLSNIKQVIACEPELQFLRLIQENIALNDARWETKLTYTSKFIGNQDNDSWCTVDRIVVDLPRPILLKIDIDGGEVDVLRGARELLAEGRALLVIETHSLQLEVDCIEYLRQFGYATTIIKDR